LRAAVFVFSVVFSSLSHIFPARVVALPHHLLILGTMAEMPPVQDICEWDPKGKAANLRDLQQT